MAEAGPTLVTTLFSLMLNSDKLGTIELQTDLKLLLTGAIIVELLVVLEGDNLLVAPEVLDDLHAVSGLLDPEGAADAEQVHVVGGETQGLDHARQPTLR